MSQRNQGNKQSEREGADHGRSHAPQRVANVEKVGSTGSGVKFGVPNHPDHSRVKGPGGSMDKG